MLMIYPAITGILMNYKEEVLASSSMTLTECFFVQSVGIPSIFFIQEQNIAQTAQVLHEAVNLPDVHTATPNSLLRIICLKHLHEMCPAI